MNAASKTGIFNYLFIEAIIKCFEKKLLIMQKWSFGERKVRMLTDLCTWESALKLPVHFPPTERRRRKKKDIWLMKYIIIGLWSFEILQPLRILKKKKSNNEFIKILIH